MLCTLVANYCVTLVAKNYALLITKNSALLLTDYNSPIYITDGYILGIGGQIVLKDDVASYSVFY